MLPYVLVRERLRRLTGVPRAGRRSAATQANAAAQGSAASKGSAAGHGAAGRAGRPALAPAVLDSVIAVAVAAAGVAGTLGARQQEARAGAAAAVVAAMGLILAGRRRFPGTVLVVMAALVGVLVLMRASVEACFIPVLIASYSAAVYGSRRVATGLVIAAGAVFLAIAIPAALGSGVWLPGHAPGRVVLAAAGAWLVGLVIRGQFTARNAHVELLRERAELAAERQAEEVRRVRIAERLRIARELHDIVAHHLSVVVIQAQGAQRTVERDPGRALAAMTQIEQAGRTALDEMRRLLGLLRSGEPAEDDVAQGAAGSYLPPPGIADLDGLAEQMRAAGLTVTVRTSGQPRPVPEDVGLTVYRVVQEALTNVLKHAGPAAAVVSLGFGDQLDIRVEDDGRGAAARVAEPAVPGAGRGTAGMRERLAALNGNLTVGPRPGGGFRVQATIPLEDS